MRQMRATRNVRRIDTCLRQALETAPGDPVLLSALSWLRFGDWQPLRGTAEGKKTFADARALAGRAYESGPNTTAGLFAMARAHFYAGDCAAGEAMGDAALRLNAYDPDITGFMRSEAHTFELQSLMRTS